MAKKALMIIAPCGFRDEEYIDPKNVLQDNGIEVITACSTEGIAVGKLGTEVTINITLKEVDTTKYNIIIYVGGPGSKEYWDDPTAHKIAREAIAFNKILAAICSAPVTLARTGLLKGIKATCFPGDAPLLKKEGAKYTAKPVEQDGLIITADGPDSAKNFAGRIVQTMEQVG